MAYFDKCGKDMQIFNDNKSVKHNELTNYVSAYLKMKVTGKCDHYSWTFKFANDANSCGIGLDSRNISVNTCFGSVNDTDEHNNWMYYCGFYVGARKYLNGVEDGTFGVKYGYKKDIVCMYLDKISFCTWILSFSVIGGYDMVKTQSHIIDRNMDKHPLFVAVCIDGIGNEIELLRHVQYHSEEREIKQKKETLSGGSNNDEPNNKDIEKLKRELLKSEEEIKRLRTANMAQKKELEVMRSEQKESDLTGFELLSKQIEGTYSLITDLTSSSSSANDNSILSSNFDLNMHSNFDQKLSDLVCEINNLKQFMKPDPLKYQTWNQTQMVSWICSLETKRFNKYKSNFINAFKSENIDNGALLTDLQRQDLKLDPFNIHDFKDRRDIIQHFQALKMTKKSNKKEVNDEIDHDNDSDHNKQEGQQTNYQ